MIIIDGRKTNLKLSSFDNLQEVLVKIVEDGFLNERVVTDILVDNEQFSEIYPHQAEDIECSDIEQVEIHSMPVQEMAMHISGELDKVNKLMHSGAREIADLFRQADDSEALELFQDLLDVTRNFLSMIALLRKDFVGIEQSLPEFSKNVEDLSGLLGEMMEVLENEDWILLSDLLEYEFLPVMDNWDSVIADLQKILTKNYQDKTGSK